MTRKLIFILIFLESTMLFAQTGTIKVKLIDKKTYETIPFANVVVFSNTVQAGGAVTNIDGEALIKVSPGKYTLKATNVGYMSVEIKKVVVSADKVKYVKMEFTKWSYRLCPQ